MILVVDDDAGVRRFVRRALENAGYQVGEAGDGEEALRLFENNYYDLLITDIVMPGTDGLQLAARAHHLSPKLRVIFMSGFADRYAEELSGSVCLSKPFTIAALLAAVESAIGLPREMAG